MMLSQQQKPNFENDLRRVQLPSAANNLTSLCSHCQLGSWVLRWCGHVQVQNLIQLNIQQLIYLTCCTVIKANMIMCFVFFLAYDVWASEQEAGNVLHGRRPCGNEAWVISLQCRGTQFPFWFIYQNKQQVIKRTMDHETKDLTPLSISLST